MTDKEEAAKYRTERNAALKEAAILKNTLTVLGVKPEIIASTTDVFKEVVPIVADGAVQGFAATEQQNTVVKTLLGGAQPDVKPADPATPTPAAPGAPATPAAVAPTAMETLIMAMATKLMGEPEADKSKAPSVPGGFTAPGGSAPSSGFTRESVAQMTPEQINANWDSISAGLSTGQLNLPTPQ